MCRREGLHKGTGEELIKASREGPTRAQWKRPAMASFVMNTGPYQRRFYSSHNIFDQMLELPSEVALYVISWTRASSVVEEGASLARPL